MMKLFGKLFQQSVILSANKVHEIFDLEFSSITSKPLEYQPKGAHYINISNHTLNTCNSLLHGKSLLFWLVTTVMGWNLSLLYLN